MTTSNDAITTNSNCDWCNAHLTGALPESAWEAGPLNHRTRALGPRRKSVRLEKPAGVRRACAGCTPLVEAGNVARLASREVMSAATRGSGAIGEFTHADVTTMFGAIQKTLIRRLPVEAP